MIWLLALFACNPPAPATLWIGGPVAVHPVPLAALEEVAGEGPALLELSGGGVPMPTIRDWPAHDEAVVYKVGEAELGLVGVDLGESALALTDSLREVRHTDHQLVLVTGGSGLLQVRQDVRDIVRTAQVAEAEAVIFATTTGAGPVVREGRMLVAYGTGPLWTEDLEEPPYAVVLDLELGDAKRPRVTVRPVRAGGPMLGPEPHPQASSVLDALETQGSSPWTVREATGARLE